MNYAVIENPHLPTGKVCHLIAGKCLPENMKKSLCDIGVDVLHPATLPYIEPAIADHADLSVCPMIYGTLILTASQIELKEKLKSLGICVIMANVEPKSPYPNDCMLNCLYNNEISIVCKAIHSTAYCSNFISVKQGYVKCSVAPVAENAILTDDAGIAKTAAEVGMDVCFIEKGDIVLHGYPYGFIGGCCGKIDKNLMAFCGDVSCHKNYSAIKSFLTQHGVEIYNLSSDQPLMDVGSLIPITQLKG